MSLLCLTVLLGITSNALAFVLPCNKAPEVFYPPIQSCPLQPAPVVVPPTSCVPSISPCGSLPPSCFGPVVAPPSPCSSPFQFVPPKPTIIEPIAPCFSKPYVAPSPVFQPSPVQVISPSCPTFTEIIKPEIIKPVPIVQPLPKFEVPKAVEIFKPSLSYLDTWSSCLGVCEELKALLKKKLLGWKVKLCQAKCGPLLNAVSSGVPVNAYTL